MSASVASVEFGSPAVMQEALKTADLSMLEVGAGTLPPINAERGMTHVGHNIDPRQHHAYINGLAQPTSDAKGKLFGLLFDFRVFGVDDLNIDDPSFQDTVAPLDEIMGDAQFDQLIFRNVFGEADSGVHFSQISDLNPSGNDYIGNSAPRNKYVTLQVATRYLKQGGLLAIEETLTPRQDYANSLRSAPQELLDPLGYAVENLREIGQSINDRHAQAFQLTATKL
jgi:hypothetical protein